MLILLLCFSAEDGKKMVAEGVIFYMFVCIINGERYTEVKNIVIFYVNLNFDTIESNA